MELNDSFASDTSSSRTLVASSGQGSSTPEYELPSTISIGTEYAESIDYHLDNLEILEALANKALEDVVSHHIATDADLEERIDFVTGQGFTIHTIQAFLREVEEAADNLLRVANGSETRTPKKALDDPDFTEALLDQAEELEKPTCEGNFSANRKPLTQSNKLTALGLCVLGNRAIHFPNKPIRDQKKSHKNKKLPTNSIDQNSSMPTSSSSHTQNKQLAHEVRHFSLPTVATQLSTESVPLPSMSVLPALTSTNETTTTRTAIEGQLRDGALNLAKALAVGAFLYVGPDVLIAMAYRILNKAASQGTGLDLSSVEELAEMNHSTPLMEFYPIAMSKGPFNI